MRLPKQMSPREAHCRIKKLLFGCFDVSAFSRGKISDTHADETVCYLDVGVERLYLTCFQVSTTTTIVKSSLTILKVL